MEYHNIITIVFQFLALGALYSIAHDIGVIKIWIIRIEHLLENRR